MSRHMLPPPILFFPSFESAQAKSCTCSVLDWAWHPHLVRALAAQAVVARVLLLGALGVKGSIRRFEVSAMPESSPVSKGTAPSPPSFPLFFGGRSVQAKELGR